MSSPTVALSHRWILSGVLCLTGSALFISAYPPWNMGLVTGWFALIPLMAAVAGASATRAAFLGWLFGLVAYLGVFAWLFAVPGFRWYHFLLLDAYLALYPALWSVIVARFVHGPMTAQIAVACAWVLLDYLRAHAGFLALPWMTLAQSQVANIPLLQTARVFGEPAVTCLVVLGNLVIWNLLSGPPARRAWIGALPVLGAIIFGASVVYSSGTDIKTHVGVGTLGTAFPAGENQSSSLPARFETLLKTLDQKLQPGVEIIALPESALVNPRLYRKQADTLQGVAKDHHVTIIAGVAEATKFDPPRADISASPSLLRSEAWIITPDREAPQQHEKSRLLPFVEEVPLRDWITWPAWLIPPVHEVTRGPAPRSYPIPGGVRVGIMICWESLFSQHARTLANDGATVLFMLANEGWFATTAAGDQHNLTARMRAAETHRAVIVSSNMGEPLVIDPFGRVIADHSSGSGTPWASATVPVVTEKTFYTLWGDIFVLGCGMFLLILTIAPRLRMRRA